jgi:hypothetical protein
MVTDSSLQELHGFASRLGLLREWFQEHARVPHYDLRPEMRERALALGAEAVGSKELFRRGREAFLREQDLKLFQKPAVNHHTSLRENDRAKGRAG